MNAKPGKRQQSWREVRRLRAWELKRKGWKQKAIAEALGVSEGAVSQWVKRAEAGGEEALYARRGGGPAARLSEDQLAGLPALLEKGAEHFGFRGDIWTRARVATLIEREFGVRYSTVHVGRLLYAPDLNPDEGVWRYLKHVELRNCCCLDLAHLRLELRKAIARFRHKSHLIRACFRHSLGDNFTLACSG